jgi:bilirubin oxidase
MINRRSFVQLLGGSALLSWREGRALAALPGGTLPPTAIHKYVTPLLIPPVMPRSNVLFGPGGLIDYYEIAVRQFRQQILPPPWDKTTVWSYGSLLAPGTMEAGGSFNYPAFTIEAKDRPVRVKWINDLKDPSTGRFLPHILPVDQTLHWANPRGPRDQRGTVQEPYTGPVPFVTHLHGAHSQQESDGYPEAWYLPTATNIPAGYFKTGTYYDLFKASSPLGSAWDPGTAVFQYENDQRATTLWYHDHTLGIVRNNIYAGPAGFYLLRGGLGDVVIGILPGPAPAPGDPPGKKYFEIPILIQDRAFNTDGSLFYPDNRAFFEGLQRSQLRIPFAPEPACGGPSDISPLHNPEVFLNTMVVNGRTWPYLEVGQRRYRFRFLNGCNSRFLILRLSDPRLRFWQIGADGGFLQAPVELSELLMAPAERADVIVDFSNVPAGTEVLLLNSGPDEPFGGGTPGVDFAPADPKTTGQVMQFRVVPASSPDFSTPPERLILPPPSFLGPASNVRQVSVNELDSATVRVATHGRGTVVLDCGGDVFGPAAALLGTLNPNGSGNPLRWMEPVTERPRLDSTEIWEIHNFTEDAHSIHVHVVQFEVINRQAFGGPVRPPERWETGRKDTVITFPGEVTRIKARFDLPGLFTWHCHILEHEDNEMMRPYRVGP